MNTEIGKLFIFLGVLLTVVGLVLVFKIHIPWLGKLPGDFYFKRNNVQIYVPIATCVLLSLILTAILYLFRK